MNNKARANAVEQAFVRRLKCLGLKMVEQVADTWVPLKKTGPATWVCKKGGSKLAGDIRAVTPFGQAVIVECKSYERLTWSCFEEHQLATLDKLFDAGGIPLIGWHDHEEYWIVPYRPGTIQKGSRDTRPALLQAALGTARDVWVYCRDRLENKRLRTGE